MDDHKSRKQIDELADLYLTGVIGEDLDTPEPKADAPSEEALEGPAPIRLSPKTDAPQTPLNASGDREPDDRHPMLRLTEEPKTDEANADERDNSPQAVATEPNQTLSGDLPDDEPAPKAMLEAVLLGNLPGMSGPWLTQYAQLIAQTEGPVAVLHVGDESIDLQVIEPRAEAEPAPTQTTSGLRIPPMRGNKTGLVGLIDALTRSDHAPTRTILVRLEASHEPAALSRLAAFEDWTLLCGSDDASTAGAGAMLRRVTHADPRLADRQVGLMVMGSDEAPARSAAARVASETDADLISPVQFIGHLKRMQPVQVREIGSFPDSAGVWPQLAAWFETLQAPEPEPVVETIIPEPTRPAPAAATAPRAGSKTENDPAPRPQRLSPAAAKLATPGSRPEPRPAFVATPPTPTSAPRTTTQQTAPPPRVAAEQKTTPPTETARPNATKPAATAIAEPTRQAPAPRVLTPETEIDLVGLIAQGPAALDDPAVLEARIPDQPNTQLAVDAQGVIHILLRTQDPAAGNEAETFDNRDAVMQLIEAGRWVREHLELLALTQRDRVFVDQEPTLHLMTGRADTATELVGKLAGQIRLHLLQQVQIGRSSGWFCTPLN